MGRATVAGFCQYLSRSGKDELCEQREKHREQCLLLSNWQILPSLWKDLNTYGCLYWIMGACWICLYRKNLYEVELVIWPPGYMTTLEVVKVKVIRLTCIRHSKEETVLLLLASGWAFWSFNMSRAHSCSAQGPPVAQLPWSTQPQAASLPHNPDYRESW